MGQSGQADWGKRVILLCCLRGAPRYNPVHFNHNANDNVSINLRIKSFCKYHSDVRISLHYCCIILHLFELCVPNKLHIYGMKWAQALKDVWSSGRKRDEARKKKVWVTKRGHIVCFLFCRTGFCLFTCVQVHPQNNPCPLKDLALHSKFTPILFNQTALKWRHAPHWLKLTHWVMSGKMCSTHFMGLLCVLS